MSIHELQPIGSHTRNRIKHKLKTTIFTKQLRLVNLSPTILNYPQFSPLEAEPVHTHQTDTANSYYGHDRPFSARSRSNSLPSFFNNSQTLNSRKRSTQHSNNLLISVLVANSLSSATAMTTADSSFHMEKDNYFACWVDNDADSAIRTDEVLLSTCLCGHCEYREELLLPPPPLPPPKDGVLVKIPRASLGDEIVQEMSESPEAPDDVDVYATRILSVVAAASRNDDQVPWNI